MGIHGPLNASWYDNPHYYDIAFRSETRRGPATSNVFEVYSGVIR
jgi:hypothetical protein